MSAKARKRVNAIMRLRLAAAKQKPIRSTEINDPEILKLLLEIQYSPDEQARASERRRQFREVGWL